MASIDGNSDFVVDEEEMVLVPHHGRPRCTGQTPDWS